MNFKMRQIGGFHIIDLPFDVFGEAKIKEFQSLITDIIYDGGKNIILNLSKVETLDGSGLGELLNLQKIALYYSVNVRLYGLNKYVRNMLSRTNLHKVFGISLSEDDDILSKIINNDKKSSEFIFAKFLEQYKNPKNTSAITA